MRSPIANDKDHRTNQYEIYGTAGLKKSSAGLTGRAVAKVIY